MLDGASQWKQSQAGGKVDGVRSAAAKPVITVLQIGLGNAEEAAGGAERVFTELEKNLPDQRVRVRAAVVSQAPDPSSQRYVFAPPGAGLFTRASGARRVLSSLISAQDVDLVASHFALYALPALDHIRRKPHVVHFHGPWSAESIEEGSGRFAAYAKHWLEKVVYHQAGRLIVLSKAFANVLAKQYQVPEDRIRIVPGSVDIARFDIHTSKDQARRMLGWPNDRPILLSVRRLSHRMGLDLLIDSMPLVIEKYPDLLLHIGGKGHLRQALEDRVVALGLTRHVRFLGFVSDEHMPLVYRAADVNIVPTRAWEGFGLVAAEALAAGTPSLVTPVGGLPEIMTPLAPEMVLPSTSVHDLSNGVLGVLSGSIRVPDAATCRAFAATHFSSSMMAKRTADVYRELLQAGEVDDINKRL